MSSDAPPASNELELTVFGPGVGECVILHIGNGDWLVVDSCFAPGTEEPVALNYFRRIGVDASTAVRRVVATHWHDDHIQGLAKVVSECKLAQFVMSNALSNSHFFQLVLEVEEQTRLVKHTSSAREFAEVLRILGARTAGKFVAGPNIYAQDGMKLFSGGHEGTSSVWALSPSSATVTNSLAGLAERIMTPGDTRRFKSLSPNDLSVALLVLVGKYHLLLGADLENSTSPHFGWQAVLASDLRPKEKAGAFKVAHHGSSNADHPDVWTTILNGDPVAIVTPFARLVTALPTQDDLNRIKNYTRQTYCTSWPVSRKPPRRQGVDGIVRGATKSRRSIANMPGHVRLRLDLNDGAASPRIELFESARKM